MLAYIYQHHGSYGMVDAQNCDPLLGDTAQIPASKMSGQSFKGPPVAAMGFMGWDPWNKDRGKKR